MCEGVSVRYGAVEALLNVSLAVGRGEVVALLGPSGSGKTTLLHAAAGFVLPAEGTISIAGREVSRPGSSLPPEKRAIGLVFQSYALWPHLSALDTVAYPLRRRGLARREALKEAAGWLDRVGLGPLAERRPSELSGGEQQRVGLARALASSPGLFLLDEPTANLDATLKDALQQEISDQQRATGAGALYVTHDPAEAFAVADRVAVLRAGQLIQVGTPPDIYAAPADAWVAALTGTSSVLHDVAVVAGAIVIRGQRVPCSVRGQRGTEVVVRPEWVAMARAGDREIRKPSAAAAHEGRLALDARVATIRFQGSYTDYVLVCGSERVIARELGPPRYTPGELVRWEPRQAAVI